VALAADGLFAFTAGAQLAGLPRSSKSRSGAAMLRAGLPLEENCSRSPPQPSFDDFHARGVHEYSTTPGDLGRPALPPALPRTATARR